MVSNVVLSEIESKVLQLTLNVLGLKEVATELALPMNKALYIKRCLYKKFKVLTNSELIVKCWSLKNE